MEKMGASHADFEPQHADAVAFIGIRRVCEIAGFSKASILRKMKKGQFPLPVIYEGNCTRWDFTEVMQWRAEQFKKRDDRTRPAQEQEGGLRD